MSISVFILVLLLFVGLNLAMIAPFLLALLLGAILAVLGRPLYRRLRARKLGPKPAALLVLAAILVLVIGPVGLFTYKAVQQGISLGGQLTQGQELSMHGLTAKIARVPGVERYFGGPAEIEKQVRPLLQRGGQSATAALLELAGKIPGLLAQGVLALITCLFLLMDGNRFAGWLRDKIPLDRDVQERISRSYRESAVSVLWASVAGAATQGLILFLAFLALGVPGAFLAGGATFLLAWIPIIGCIPVWLAGGALLVAKGSVVKALLMVAAGIFASFADNVMRPWVLKGRGDMHPLLSLVAILGGVQAFGILGVLLGPILMAILLTLLEIWPMMGARAGWMGERRAAPPLSPSMTKRTA